MTSNSSSWASPCDGAPGHVAHCIAARADGGEPGLFDAREHVRQRRELEVVELDRLTGRELAGVASVLERELPDRAQLGGVRRPAGSLIRSMNVPIFGLSW